MCVHANTAAKPLFLPGTGMKLVFILPFSTWSFVGTGLVSFAKRKVAMLDALCACPPSMGPGPQAAQRPVHFTFSPWQGAEAAS